MAFRCDAGGHVGVGHFVRDLALAQEISRRGGEVVFFGDVGRTPWAARQLGELQVNIEDAPGQPEALARLAVQRGVSAIVLDGYDLDAGTGAALRAREVRVLAVVDGPFGAGQEADLYLDQNLGAGRPPDVPDGSTVLVGPDYALFRDLVLDRRPAATVRAARGERPPAVLAVFGGTDPYHAAETVVPLLLGTGLAMRVTAITPHPGAHDVLAALPLGPGQTVHRLPLVDDLPALVTRSDLVVSAAGTSVWELCCLGAAAALVCVTDNQELGYRRVVQRRLARGLGHLRDLAGPGPHREAAAGTLVELVRRTDLRRVLAARGAALVDGRGRERVADALLRGLRVTSDPAAPAPSEGSR